MVVDTASIRAALRGGVVPFVIPYIRKQRILATLEKLELTYVEQLAAELNISISTVRRDIKKLAEDGRVTSLRGGAVKLNRGVYDVPLDEKRQLNSDKKRKIAKLAASLVNSGDIIYLDSGTTTLQMARYLKKKRITVVTSNTKAVDELMDSEVTLITLGGEVNKRLGSIIGPATETMLQTMVFDKSFIGASGYSILGGINTHDAREAAKKALARSRAKVAYVLADASKSGLDTFCKAFELSEAIILTDEENELLKNHATYIVA